MKNLLLLALMVVTTSAFATNGPKKVDIKSSSVKWHAAKITGEHEGYVNLKDGALEFDNGVLVGGHFTVDMTSITCTDLEGEYKGKLEGHLKSDDFFGVETYPNAKFKVTKAKKTTGNTYSVTGDLTIKGKTHPITFDADVTDNSASATLKVDRTKYDVRYGSGKFFDNLGDKTIYDEFDLTINLKF